jgi:hypothetical protein
MDLPPRAATFRSDSPIQLKCWYRPERTPLSYVRLQLSQDQSRHGAGTGTMHIILAVTDHGTPRLTRYARVIIEIVQ